MGESLPRIRSRVEAATKQQPVDTGLLVLPPGGALFAGRHARRHTLRRRGLRPANARIGGRHFADLSGLYDVLRLQVAYLSRDFELARRCWAVALSAYRF